MSINENQLDEIKALLKGLAEELHWPKDRVANISAKTSFDRNLGLDSLSRVELFGRVERRFQVSLGEGSYASIDTIGELLTAVQNARGDDDHTRSTVAPFRDLAAFTREESEKAIPTEAKTIHDVIEFHVKSHPDRIHLVYQEDGQKEIPLTFRRLLDGAMNVAAGLRRYGVARGEAVSIMLPTSLDYFFTFLGTILAGAVPVPIYPPSRPSQLEDHLLRHAAILGNCRAQILVTTPAMVVGMARLLKLNVATLKSVVATVDLIHDDAVVVEPANSADTAFLQYTSGSTGNPKGVILSHENILANIRAMGAALQASPRDVFVSWLPLYHDMGLIGAWLGSLFFGNLFVVMSPYSFLSRPTRWLSNIQHYRATLTAAPNFAFELCLKHVTDADIASLDLSSLRAMCNGAEAVIPETVTRFVERFSQAGLKESAMMPVYGLAENSVGLLFPPLGRKPRIDVIDRSMFLKQGFASSETGGRLESQMRFVACGKPLVQHEVRVVDSADHEVAERHEGFLQFRGPSSTVGYLRNEEKTKELFHGSWLDTGDLAYLAEGDLFITGRVKGIIKHAGRNIHPEEVETAVGSLPEIRKGCVVAFGSMDPERGTEKLVVVAETRESDNYKRSLIRERINLLVGKMLGSPPDDLLVVPPHTILKTSSGKVRRAASKNLYETGLLLRTPSGLRWQVIHYILTSFSDRIEAQVSAGWLILRSCIIWIICFVVILVGWPLMILGPTLTLRWHVTRAAAWIALKVAGVSLTIKGRENLRPEPSIYVSNHSSYLDVVVLIMALPWPVTFIAKAELGHTLVGRWTLRRLGVSFVERFEIKKTIEDSRRLVELTKKGTSILSFPEGTFTRKPGVLPFHLGPFMAAVQTGEPLCPIVIRGSRSILHPDDWMLRSGPVSIQFLPALKSAQLFQDDASKHLSDFERAVRAQSTVRSLIIKNSGEADLAEEIPLIGDLKPQMTKPLKA